jgi:hypothetical protein
MTEKWTSKLNQKTEELKCSKLTVNWFSGSVICSPNNHGDSGPNKHGARHTPSDPTSIAASRAGISGPPTAVSSPPKVSSVHRRIRALSTPNPLSRWVGLQAPLSTAFPLPAACSLWSRVVVQAIDDLFTAHDRRNNTATQLAARILLELPQHLLVDMGSSWGRARHILGPS